MIRFAAAALALAATVAALGAQSAPPRPRALSPHEALGKDILKELVEIDTTQKGSTAPAAAAMAARLTGRRVPARRRSRAGTGPRSRQPGGAAARARQPAQANPGDGPPRRRGRAAAGLDRGSVPLPRTRRLVLRPRHDRRQGRGRDLDGHVHPAAPRGLRPRPGPRAHAHRRRGGRRSQQRHRLAAHAPPRAHRRRVRAQRGRRRRGEAGPPPVAQRPGEREDLSELRAAGHQQRRPQLAAAPRQRHRPALVGAHPGGRLHLSGAAQRGDACVLRAHGRD